ncbi:hypothetical protein, partial [Mesorhizobium sp. M7A.F.Ca.AU.002.04.1.1]|uniref:hypothetical protein n=1 Tax=Mesorhizobium sp. M7A.F.Ca.AU.002.04.1.1 TaxID=2496673 RepID=UPI0019D42081
MNEARHHVVVVGAGFGGLEFTRALAGAVDTGDIGEQRRHILALAQEVADRPGNLGGGQRRRRHL